jgi:alkylated DNA repair dioxygenase AlkB
MYKSICSLYDKINVHYHKNIFHSIDAANDAFDILDKNVKYNSDEESMVFIMGRYIKIPRRQVAYGEKGTVYEFAGTTVPAIDWNSDDPVCKLIKKIKKKMELLSHTTFNFVLINRYDNGNEYIGFHSDDEKELGDNPIIAGVSLGAERDVVFKSNKPTEIIDNTQNLFLNHGSGFIMRDQTNTNWKHSIPKRANINTARISLTFRYINL